MARVKDDVDKLWDVFGFVGMLSIEATGYTIGAIIAMVRLAWKLSIVPLLTLPVIGVMAVSLERKLGKIYGDISEQNAVLNTVVQENLSGVRTVKSFAGEEYELKKFRRSNNRYSELNVDQIYSQNNEAFCTASGRTCCNKRQYDTRSSHGIYTICQQYRMAYAEHGMAYELTCRRNSLQ